LAASSLVEKSERDPDLTVVCDTAMGSRVSDQRAKGLGSGEALKRLERLPGAER
jgi:hypothetical protein